MEHILKIFIPGLPIGKGRPRVTTKGGRVRTYTPAKTASYETMVRQAAVDAMALANLNEPVAGGLAVHISVMFPPSKVLVKRSVKENKELTEYRHTSRPDLDNVVKAIFDGLNGVAFFDDSQVDMLTAIKGYDAVTGVSVALRWEEQE